jgi:hypothetical protein
MLTGRDPGPQPRAVARYCLVSDFPHIPGLGSLEDYPMATSRSKGRGRKERHATEIEVAFARGEETSRR